MSDKSNDKKNKAKRQRGNKRKLDEDNDKTENARLSNEHADGGFVQVPPRVNSKGNDQPNTTESSTPYAVTNSNPEIHKQHQGIDPIHDRNTLETAEILLQLKLTIPENLSTNQSKYKTKISLCHAPIKPAVNKNIDDKVYVSISAPICPASSVHTSNIPSSSETYKQERLNNNQRSNSDNRNIGDRQPKTLFKSELETLQGRPHQPQMDQPPQGRSPLRRRTLLSPSELEEASRNEAVRYHMLARNRTIENLNDLTVDVLPTSSETDRPSRSVASSTHSTIYNINDSIAGALRPTSVHRRRHRSIDSNITNNPPPYPTAQSVSHLTRDLTTPNFGTNPNGHSLRLNQSSQMTHSQQSNYIHPMPRSQIEYAEPHNIDYHNLNISSDSNLYYHPSAATHATDAGSHLGNYMHQQSNYGFNRNEQTTQMAQHDMYLNEQVYPPLVPSYPISGHPVNQMRNEHVNQQFSFSNDFNQPRFIYDEPTPENQMFQSFACQRGGHLSNPDLNRYPYPADVMFSNSTQTIHRPIDQSRPRHEQFSQFTYPQPIAPISEHIFRVPEVPAQRTQTSRSKYKTAKKSPSCKPSNSKSMHEVRRPSATITTQHAVYPKTMTFPVTSGMTITPKKEVPTTIYSTSTMIGEPETSMSKPQKKVFHVSVPQDSELTKQWTTFLAPDSTSMSATTETSMSIAEEQPITSTMSSLTNVPAAVYSTPQTVPLVDCTSTNSSTTTTIIDAPETSMQNTESQQRICAPGFVQPPSDVQIKVSTSETMMESQSSLYHVQSVTFPVTTVMMCQQIPVLVTSTNQNAVTLILTPQTSTVPTTAQSETVPPTVVNSQNSTVDHTPTIALATVLHPPNTALVITVTQPNIPQQRLITPHIAVVESQTNPPSTIEEQSPTLAQRYSSPHISVIQTPQNPPPISRSASQSTRLTSFETRPPIPSLETMPPLIEIPRRLSSSQRSTCPQVSRPPNMSNQNLAPTQAHVPEVAHTTDGSSESSPQYRRLYNSNLYLPTRPYSARPDFYTPHRRYAPAMTQNRQPVYQTAPEEDVEASNRQNVPDNSNS